MGVPRGGHLHLTMMEWILRFPFVLETYIYDHGKRPSFSLFR